MPINFQLTERLAGFTLSSVAPGEMAQLMTRELVAPTDAVHLMGRLEQFQIALFDKIPGLPFPSMIDHMLVIIRQDLSGTAYVNELAIKALVKANKDVEAGTPVFLGLQETRAKESLSPVMGVFTYNHLLKTAEHVLELMRSAGRQLAPRLSGV